MSDNTIQEESINVSEAPLCACGCGNQTIWSKRQRKYNKYLRNHNHIGKRHKQVQMRLNNSAPLCECGCGFFTTFSEGKKNWNRFICGHQKKKEPTTPQPYCQCGCGQLVKWSITFKKWNKFILGHHTQGQWQQTEYREKQKQFRNAEYRQLQRDKANKQWEDADFRKIRTDAINKQWQSEEFRKIRSKSAKKQWEDDHFRESRRNKLNTLWESAEFKEKHSQILKKQWEDPIFRENNIAKTKEKWLDPIYRENRQKDQSQRMILRWQDPDYLRTYFASINRKPNNPEKLLMALTSENIEYVGDGKFWRTLKLETTDGTITKHKNPDLKVRGQNKVIEVFGDYWHKGENPEILINAYRVSGLECLVIWESEIKQDINKVLDRIADFVGEQNWQMNLSI